MNMIEALEASPERPRLLELQVSGYRAFDQLSIPRLGRVNLFVGPNSAGKSSLLEAVQLYASGGAPATIASLLVARDELSPRAIELGEEDVEVLNPALLQLFHRRDSDSPARCIRIGPGSDSEQAVTIERGWVVQQASDKPYFASDLSNSDLLGGPSRALQVTVGERISYQRVVPLQKLRSFIREVPWEEFVPWTYVGANGLAAPHIAELWDRIALTDVEEEVLAGLRILAPIERLSLVGDFDGRGERKPVVKVPGFRRPVPLRTLGDGASRLFGLMLALVNAQHGLLLVDEIENGLHVSVQDEVWRAIFSLAERLDVQVFATTHSWDAIVGFQYAANLSTAEGMLYRLERRKDGSIFPTAYTERDAEIAARQEIEVR